MSNIGRWPTLGGAVISVVEDDEVVRYTFERVLRAAGATVEVADNADAGLALVRARPPAAFVIDVVLRGKNGRWLAREIRATAPEVKLLAVTGYFSQEMSGEFDAVLEKPVEPEALCVSLAELLRS